MAKKLAMDYAVILPGKWRFGNIPSIAVTSAFSESDAIGNVFARYFGKPAFGHNGQYFQFREGSNEDGYTVTDLAFPLDGIDPDCLRRDPELESKRHFTEKGLLAEEIFRRFGEDKHAYADLASRVSVKLNGEDSLTCAEVIAETILAQAR